MPVTPISASEPAEVRCRYATGSLGFEKRGCGESLGGSGGLFVLPALFVLTEARHAPLRRPRGGSSGPAAPRPRAVGSLPPRPARGAAPAPGPAPAAAAAAAPPAAFGPLGRVHRGGARPLGLRPHLRPRPRRPGRAPGRRPPEPRPGRRGRPPLRGRAAAGAVPHARLAGGRVLRAGPRLGSRGAREPCSLPPGRAPGPRGGGRAGALGLPRDAGSGHHRPRRAPRGGRPLRPPSRVPLGARGPGHRPPGPVGGGGTLAGRGAQGPGAASCPGDRHGALGPVWSPRGPEEGPGRARSPRWAPRGGGRSAAARAGRVAEGSVCAQR